MSAAAAAPAVPADALQRFVEGLTAVSGVPAIAVLARSDGAAICAASGSWSGCRSEDEMPRVAIGCIGKTLVSTVALLLWEAHELDIDAPLAHYLPELEADPKAASILVRHLMCNTPGYAGMTALGPGAASLTREGFFDEIRAAPQLFEPGTVYDYDHSAAVLLAAIVERITGRSATGLVDETILAPLGVRPHDGSRATHPPGGGPGAGFAGLSPIWSAAISERELSLRQLVDLAELLSAGRAPGCPLVLSDAVRALLGTRAIHVPEGVGGLLSHCLPTGYTLGLAEYANDMLGRDGTSEGAVVSVRASRDGRVAFAAAVASYAPLVRHRLVDAILSELGRAAAPRVKSAPLGIDAAELPGRYANSGSLDIRVRAAGEQLTMTATVARGQTIELAGRLDDTGCLEITGAARTAGLTFFRDPCGGAPCVMFGLRALRKISDRP